MGRSYKVAVIGAGMAGLSAAGHLMSRGVTDIVVLEGRDRVGGRICTKRGGEVFLARVHWVKKTASRALNAHCKCF